MSFRNFFLRKRIIIPLILIIGAIVFFKIRLSNDIPITKPNVNNQSLGHLEIEDDILTNRWKDTMHMESIRLTVKESRSNLSSNKIEIYMQRLRSINPSTFPPIFFLAGGPGSSGTRIGMSEYFYLFKKLRENSDVILLDQRGTGGSVPNLSCRNSLWLPTDITTDIKDQLLKSIEEKCIECAEEFQNMGIQLQAYNSVESAQDIEEIRKALGYNKITLYGVSYGTELAQFYIKEYEQNVEKAILAGPVAPDQGLKLPIDLQSQFDNMDSLIRLDPKLSKYIPDFSQLMRDVHNQLKRNPKYIEIPLMDAVSDDDGFIPTTIFRIISFFRPYWKMTLTDEHLQMITSNFIGNDFWIKRFPEFYYKMSLGNFQDVGNIIRNFRRQSMPNALFFTVNGSTGYSAERWQFAIDQESQTILSNFGISFGRYPKIFEAFGIEKQEGWNEPVSGETQILLIGGTLDGRTPPSHMDTLARRFPNHQKIIIENAGHNRMIDVQIMNGILAFVNDSLDHNIVTHRDVQFITPVPYQNNFTDTLLYTIEHRSVEHAIDLHGELCEKYRNSNDYIFDCSENALNTFGYYLIGRGKLEDAEQILKYNIELFPVAYNPYNSLGEVQLMLGDTLSAIRNFEKAVNLNYFDTNSQGMLKQLN